MGLWSSASALVRFLTSLHSHAFLTPLRDPVTGKPLPWVPGQPRRDPQDVLIFRSRPSALRFKESGQDSKDAGLGAFKKHLLADLAKKNQPPAPPLPPPPVEPAAGSSDAAGADADVPVPLRRPLRKRPLPEQSLPDRRPASAPGAKSLVGGKRTATAAELLPPRAPPQQQQQQHQAAAAKRRRADPKAGASGADLLLLAAAAAAEDKQGQNAAGAAGGAAPASASALRWVRGAANVLKQGAPAPSKSTAPGAAARGATRSNVAAPERQETAQHARSNGSTTDAAGSRPKMLKMSSLLDLL